MIKYIGFLLNFNNDLASTNSAVSSNTTKIKTNTNNISSLTTKVNTNISNISTNTNNIDTLNTKVEELIKCVLLRGASGVETTVTIPNVWTLIKMTNSDVECYATDFVSINADGTFTLGPGYYYISASIYSKYSSTYTGNNDITIALRGSDNTEYNIYIDSYYTTGKKSSAGPQLAGKIIYLTEDATIGLYARAYNKETIVSNGNAATWVSIVRLHD